MVEVDRGEGRLKERCVAIAASFGRGHVVHRLADCRHTVMAGRARLIDEGMIDDRAGELQSGMAGRTVVRRRHMVLRLAGCGLAIVAGDAGALHVVVVNAYFLHVCCDVAVVTGVGSGYVVRRFSLGARPVVAGCTGLIDVRVVKGEGHEVPGRVALGALVARGRVRGGLAFCDRPVVATRAVPRCPGKLVVDVAALADDLGVRAGQRYAKLAVIKSLDRLYALNCLLRGGR